MSEGDPITKFLQLIRRHRTFISDCEELDHYYENQEQAKWKRRANGSRGWTSADVRRHAIRDLMSDVPVPTVYPVVRSRVCSAFKIYPMHRDCKAAWKAALSHARSCPEFEDVAQEIRRMGNLHLDWIEAETEGRLDWFDAEEAEYQETFRQLERLLRHTEETEPEEKWIEFKSRDIDKDRSALTRDKEKGIVRRVPGKRGVWTCKASDRWRYFDD